MTLASTNSTPCVVDVSDVVFVSSTSIASSWEWFRSAPGLTLAVLTAIAVVAASAIETVVIRAVSSSSVHVLVSSLRS